MRILESMRVAGVVTALALAAAAHAEAAPTAAADTLARRVTLEEAVALARENAPGIIQAEGQKRTSAADVRSAYAAFLPSVSLSAGASRQIPATGSRTRVENGQVITVPTDPWSSNIGLGASVTLFEGGRRITDLQQAHGQADAAEVNSVVQVYAATLSVKQQFFNLLAARETEMAARSQLAQAEQQKRTALAQVRARTATRSDSLRAEIQVRSADLALMDARDAQEVAVTGLTRATGSPYPITAAETDSVAYTGLSLSEEALRELAENAPAVRLAQTALASARAALRGTWAGYLP